MTLTESAPKSRIRLPREGSNVKAVFVFALHALSMEDPAEITLDDLKRAIERETGLYPKDHTVYAAIKDLKEYFEPAGISVTPRNKFRSYIVSDQKQTIPTK